MKKKILLFVLCVISYSSFAQVLHGYVKNSLTNEILEYANIAFLKNNKGTNSNSEGYYTINVAKNLKDSLKISYVGYESKYILLDGFNESKIYSLDISLVKKTTNLDEVIVETKKRNFTQKKSLGEERKDNIAMFSLIGHETACYIENPYQQEGRLKTIKLDVKRNPEANFIAKFNVKIYEFDKENNQPGQELIGENLIIVPKNKNYKLKIDVQKFKIPFPKEGICIGIELIDSENESKKGDKIGPGLRFTNKETEQITWYNYRGKGFYQGNLGHKAKTGNLIVGVDILMEK